MSLGLEIVPGPRWVLPTTPTFPFPPASGLPWEKQGVGSREAPGQVGWGWLKAMPAGPGFQEDKDACGTGVQDVGTMTVCACGASLQLSD